MYITVGALIGAALAGLLFILSRLGMVSFVPLDAADAVILLTPGAVATQTIEIIGPWGKRLVELAGVAGFVVAWGILGLLAGRLLTRATPAVPLRMAVIWLAAAILPLALTLLVEYGVPANRVAIPSTYAPVLLALLYAIAAAALLALLRSIQATREVSQQRRLFLAGGGAALAVAALGWLGGRLVTRGATARAGAALPSTAPVIPPPASSTSASPTASVSATAGASAVPSAALAVASPVAEPSSPAPAEASPAASTPTPPPAFVAAPGTREEVTKQEFLYVISSSTRDPIVDPATWRLRIGGLVEAPFELSYDELLALPRVDQTSTMECISNEVGNYLIGNCNWNGVRLRDLLERAGVRSGVVDVVFRAADGYSESLPLDAALDEQTLIAYGIDGQALETKHGFPARIRVPGKYGEKNVKWLTEIELVETDYQGYWQQRGWTDDATIFTTSVFDTGNNFTTDGKLIRENGSVALGGIAFAGARGIHKVELQIDGGAWNAAELKDVAPISWRLWRYDWPTRPGRYRLAVRAVDGTGELQTDRIQDTHPDGATGYHVIDVDVADP